MHINAQSCFFSPTRDTEDGQGFFAQFDPSKVEKLLIGARGELKLRMTMAICFNEIVRIVCSWKSQLN